MAQEDIIKLLSKQKIPLRSKKMAMILKINHYNVCHNLKKLVDQRIVTFKKIKIKGIDKPIKIYWLK